MTRVDFYILPETDGPGGSVVMTACKLCDKATLGGSRVYIYAPTAELVDALDSALWSFRQGSFIGHERHPGELLQPLPAVLIGSEEPPDAYQQILINLGAEVPPFFSRFDRVLEIVEGAAAPRAQSRVRFKFYRDRGYELNTHNL